MSEKDLKLINDLARKERERIGNMSQEDAMKMLIDAGIFNKEGKYNEAYKNLERATTETK